MTIGELITQLEQFPADWVVWPTKKASLEVSEPGAGAGRQYGFLFIDGRKPAMYRTSR